VAEGLTLRVSAEGESPKEGFVSPGVPCALLEIKVSAKECSALPSSAQYSSITYASYKHTLILKPIKLLLGVGSWKI